MCVSVCVCVHIWSFYIQDTRKGHFFFDSMFVPSLRSTVIYYNLYSSINITIIFIIITIIIIKYIILLFSLCYCKYLPIFTLVATYVRTICWFQTWFPFCQCVLPKLCIINFLLLQASFCTIFLFPYFFGCHSQLRQKGKNSSQWIRAA